uniref:Uncharacterized protein n=1 Tax=Arundo donax TaxID=35708 RepID=A0A0A9E6B7_ARUDO
MSSGMKEWLRKFGLDQRHLLYLKNLQVAVSPPLLLSFPDSFGTGKGPANLVIFQIAMGWHVLKSPGQISTVPDKLHNWRVQKFSEVHILLLACS